MNLPAISLWQPWASVLFVPKLKPIETRHWKTTFRGKLVIHAAKKQSWELAHLFSLKLTDPRNTDHLVNAKIDSYLSLPFGALIGTVEMTECIATSSDDLPDSCPCPDAVDSIINRERFGPFLEGAAWDVAESWGDFSANRFGWCFKNPQLFPEPIPCIGRQGFFSVEVPA